MAKYIELGKAFEEICSTEYRCETKIAFAMILLNAPMIDIDLEKKSEEEIVVKKKTVERMFKQIDDFIRICPKHGMTEMYKKELVSLIAHCKSMISEDIR